MKQRTVSCPACAAPLTFHIGAAVSVCEFCQSAVARTDKDVQDYGKVADLAQTATRLRVGMTGTFLGKPFTIVGRVQYQHAAGGVWDEWYLTFPGGKWGWLAEAQGETYLMFERRLSSAAKLPAIDTIDPGATVRFGKVDFVAKEVGTAHARTAEGEIPWGFRPGEEHKYVDLVAAEDTFATFDYGDPPRAFVGKRITLDSLDLHGFHWDGQPETIAVTAQQLNCPNCAGPLALRVPDKSERITCPNCDSLLDVDQGGLKFFKTLRVKRDVQPVIPLGSEGKLGGGNFTVIGFLQRAVRYQGTDYPWTEYLLHDQNVGFRWLVCNQWHWSFVSPATKPVAIDDRFAKSQRYDGDKFALYERTTARVKYVLGEFYWRVEVGEEVSIADFIAPPRILSIERTVIGGSQEINISVGQYMPVEDVEAAFGLANLPRSWGVGVIQPRPDVGLGVFLLWGLFVVLMLAMFVVTSADMGVAMVGVFVLSIVPGAILIFFYGFERKRWEDSDFSPYATE